MKIKIVCVGKIKEKFYRDAVDEYAKRLSRYTKFEVVEVTDEKTPDGASDLVNAKIIKAEGDRILSKIRDDDYVIALAIKGKSYTSEAFAAHLDQLMTGGKSSIVCVIGGSLGLDSSVLKRANEQLSFSSFTYPHQLMRVILAEQVYRAFRIINNEPYHK